MIQLKFQIEISIIFNNILIIFMIKNVYILYYTYIIQLNTNHY